jgi:hypothetical protein
MCGDDPHLQAKIGPAGCRVGADQRPLSNLDLFLRFRAARPKILGLFCGLHCAVLRIDGLSFLGAALR